MNQNYYCHLHTNEIYEFVCISQHQCQRKLCSQCQSQHQTEESNSKFITINEFLEIYNLIFTELIDDKQIDIKLDNLKRKIIDLESRNKKETADKLMESLIVLSKDLNEYFLDLNIIKQKLSQRKINNFSNQELEILIENNISETVAAVNKYKLSCLEIIFNQAQLIVDQLDDQNIEVEENIRKNNIIVETQVIQMDYYDKNIVEEIQLIGDKHFGMLHGNFYYKINNDVVKHAGQYKFNQKVGQWRDIDKNITSFGEYRHGKRIGIWKFSINRNLIAECFYNQDGQKHGQWVDIIPKSMKYCCNILYVGKYENGKRIGKWTIISKDIKEIGQQQIGGGKYDQNGNKVDQWLEVKEYNSFSEALVIWIGRYRAGVRIGRWNVAVKDSPYDPKIFIGGGLYNQNGKKIGDWIDIDVFQIEEALLSWSGLYQEGIRVGEWVMSQHNLYGQLVKKIGGGKYDQRGRKIGNWIETIENYGKILPEIFWEGSYQEDIRIGQWKLCYLQKQTNNFIQIGGGEYDEKGNKIGIWGDIEESNQILQEGQVLGGHRVGKWKIKFHQISENEFKHLAGGKYDKSGKQSGFWIYLNKKYFRDDAQVIWDGQYKDGFRFKKWRINYRANSNNPFRQIGGGYYDDNGVKIGHWIDISEQFYSIRTQVIQEGEYKEGIRVGQWQIKFRRHGELEFSQIGGGMYDNSGNKVGFWVDVNECYYNKENQVVWQGLYQSGVRVGEWKIKYRKLNSTNDIVIGGGQYQNGIKVGKWQDLLRYDETYTFTTNYGYH